MIGLCRWTRSLFLSGLVLSTCCFAQTTANGPYYATPSWDQVFPIATRFVVLANFNSEAVLDRETGLVWWRKDSTSDPSSSSGLDYGAAGLYCNVALIGGRHGWRLPTLMELASLTEGVVDPASPFNYAYQNYTFWSTTTLINSPYVLFWHFAPVYAEQTNGGNRQFTCVRGGLQTMD